MFPGYLTILVWSALWSLCTGSGLSLTGLKSKLVPAVVPFLTQASDLSSKGNPETLRHSQPCSGTNQQAKLGPRAVMPALSALCSQML